MKATVLRTGLAVAAIAFAIAPGHAQSADPCAVFMCMAGISGVGATGGPACAPTVTFWHALAVYSPFFNPPASAARRKTYLMTCPGADLAANVVIVDDIIYWWGSLP